jgi:hypothetical protein
MAGDDLTLARSGSFTAHTDSAARRCHTGSSATTRADPTSIGDRPPISRVHNVCG